METSQHPYHQILDLILVIFGDYGGQVFQHPAVVSKVFFNQLQCPHRFVEIAGNAALYIMRITETVQRKAQVDIQFRTILADLFYPGDDPVRLQSVGRDIHVLYLVILVEHLYNFR